VSLRASFPCRRYVTFVMLECGGCDARVCVYGISGRVTNRRMSARWATRLTDGEPRAPGPAACANRGQPSGSLILCLRCRLLDITPEGTGSLSKNHGSTAAGPLHRASADSMQRGCFYVLCPSATRHLFRIRSFIMNSIQVAKIMQKRRGSRRISLDRTALWYRMQCSSLTRTRHVMACAGAASWALE
jgi:hypothetical protein